MCVSFLQNCKPLIRVSFAKALAGFRQRSLRSQDVKHAFLSGCNRKTEVLQLPCVLFFFKEVTYWNPPALLLYRKIPKRERVRLKPRVKATISK